MGYRKPEEIESYIARDPIEILGNKIISSGVISEILLKKLASQINYYVEDTFISMLQRNENYLKQFEMNK
jgi:TPP-dependent pyruvate/acetoin dehydrogenase alpha subunit